jgi:hypothetical protein
MNLQKRLEMSKPFDRRRIPARHESVKHVLQIARRLPIFSKWGQACAVDIQEVLKMAETLEASERLAPSEVIPTKRIHKLTVNLLESDMETLRNLAETQGITMTDALRKALATEDYIRDALRHRYKILVEKPDNTQRELVFR